MCMVGWVVIGYSLLVGNESVKTKGKHNDAEKSDDDNGSGGGIARMQMWLGVKSAEEIAKMAKSAHAKVKPTNPKKAK